MRWGGRESHHALRGAQNLVSNCGSESQSQDCWRSFTDRLWSLLGWLPLASACCSPCTWRRRGSTINGSAKLAGFWYIPSNSLACNYSCGIPVNFGSLGAVFQLHQSLMTATCLLTCAGFVLIFVDLKGWVPVSVAEEPHALIGTITTGPLS